MNRNFAIVSIIAFLLTSLIACTQTVTEPSVNENASSKPKKIILMVSDGIGFNGWLAADYYQGLAGKQSYQIERPDGTKPLLFGLEHGALNLVDDAGNVLPRKTDLDDVRGVIAQPYNPQTRWLAFENAMINDFKDSGSYTTYTDSAAAGTALLSGRKTSVGRVNTDWTGTEQFTTIAEIAMANKLSAGAVTSVMASHATPAAVISHNVSRNNYADIFNEMLASDLRVIMGAGHPQFDSSGNAQNDTQDFKYVGGESTFNQMTSSKGINGFEYVETIAEFEALASGKTLPQRVVGIVQSDSTLQASRANLDTADTPSEMTFNSRTPDLATMSVGALNVLAQDQDGFFVMIEGGAVDWMGHANNMPRFIEEQIDFNKAVDAVIEWVETNSSWDETLLIITSDHECGGIWGEGTWTNSEGGAVASERTDDALRNARFNPSEDVFNDYLAVQDKGEGVVPGFQFSSSNHTNDLVPLWAIGKGASEFNQFVRTDVKAAELWGKQYGWNGNYVDNTTVFQVMYNRLMQDE